MSYSVGDTITIDNIESVIIYDAGSEQEWGRYILVDKNHDLSYYISGDDFLNKDIEDDDSYGCISLEAKYGYEWGGLSISTSIIDQSIGKGLTNTNSLINLNLEPFLTYNWEVLWEKVKIFRENIVTNNGWFIPSPQELLQIISHASLLNNLSLQIVPQYWTSSEYDSYNAVVFKENTLSFSNKNVHKFRARLCRYTTDQELDSLKTLQISSSTPEANIYYTTDNSTPTSSSNLYTNTFQANIGTTIKAIGIKEGYLDSDIAEFTVS